DEPEFLPTLDGEVKAETNLIGVAHARPDLAECELRLVRERRKYTSRLRPHGFAVVTCDAITIHVPDSRVHTSMTQSPPLKNRAITTSPRTVFCSRERGT